MAKWATKEFEGAADLEDKEDPGPIPVPLPKDDVLSEDDAKTENKP